MTKINKIIINSLIQIIKKLSYTQRLEIQRT